MQNGVQRIDLEGGYYMSPVHAGDKAAYMAHFADVEIARNLLRVPFPYTSADADWWIAHRRANARDPETHFAIRRADGFLVGGIGMSGEDPVPVAPAEIGYWLAAECRGKGLMPIAIRAFAQHCFTRLDLSEVTALPFHWNAASCRTLEKAGFTLAGRLPGRFTKGGEKIDALDYRLRRG